MKIDWKRKLSSRKFWAAVIGFVSAILVACNYDKLTIEQVAAVISAAGVLVAYIISEGAVDVTYAKSADQTGATTDSNAPSNAPSYRQFRA